MNLRERLKVETRQAHARLDEQMRQQNPFENPQNYGRYLTGMLRLHLRSQPGLAWIETAAGLPPRRVGLEELLRRDLRSIGMEFVPESPAPPPTDQSVATRWGEAYVMEGSALGGRFLLREASDSLPAGTGLAWLEQLAEDATSRWKIFVAALDQAGSDDLNHEECLAAASAHFKAAREIFAALADELQGWHTRG